MKSSIYFLIISGALILIFFGSFLLFRNQTKAQSKIKIGGQIIQVEIADSAEKMTKGLSNRENLPENFGMLFVFNEPGYYAFWMRDMRFSLDFVWILNNQIVELDENIAPADFQPPKTLIPQNKINRVLEIKAGMTQKAKIKVGDKIEYSWDIAQ